MSLTVENITDFILLGSGQFPGGLDSTLLSSDQINHLIKRELAVYSRYLPNKVKQIRELSNSMVFSDPVPLFISEIRRTNKDIYLMQYSNTNVSVIPKAIWRYDAPVLEFRYPTDSYEVTYFTNHELEDIEGVMQISSMDLSDNLFLDLVLGRFMITLGRSRRMFKLDNLPFEIDSSEMVSEGNEIYNTAVEEIKNSSKFYAAVFT